MNDHLATIDGASILLDSETHNLYPGGVERAAERRRILGRHLRPVSLECLRKGMHRKAWQLYLETVRWHTRERRWKYLLGFPAEAVLSSLKGLSAYE